MPCGVMTPAGIPMYDDVPIFGTRGALINDMVPTLGTDDNDNDNDNDKVFYSTLIIHLISHITVINAFAY